MMMMIIELKIICELQLPKQPNQSTRIQQLTGRWQYDGIIRLALLMLTFLIRSATSQSNSYPFALMRLGEPHSRSSTHLKPWKCRELNPRHHIQ